MLNTSLELLPGNPKVRKMIVAYRANMRSAFYAGLKHGVAQGHISKNTDCAAMSLLLFTLMNGIRATSASNASEKELKDMVEDVLGLIE